MNSKKKNKNRQNKPPNLNPPQKQEVFEPPSPPQVINSEEVESVVEERVPSIVSENVAAEVKEPEETPKKPKRNRGKKKKESEKSDKDDEVRVELPIIESGLQPDKDIQDETDIAPATRRNKSKNKKGQGSTPAEKLEQTETERNFQFEQGNVGTQEVTESNVEEPEQEIKSAKKKNKKKKNRNDSDRSEKQEEVSCTSPFQKLLEEDVQSKTVSKPSTDDSSISEATVKEVEMAPKTDISTEVKSQEMLHKHESNKNKKNNKKEKKQPPVSDEPIAIEKTESVQVKSTESKNLNLPSVVGDIASEKIEKTTDSAENIDESMPSSSTVDEKTIKQKAKIAKPVEKKKKGKRDEKLHEAAEDKIAPEAKHEIVEGVKSTENVIVQESSPTDSTAVTEDLDDIILVPLTEMTPDWQEEVKTEEKNGPVIGCEDKNEITVMKPLKLEKNKNKNKSSKTEIATSSGTASVPLELEATLLQASCSSTEQVGFEHADLLKVKSEEMTQTPEDKIEQESGNTDIIDKTKEPTSSSKLDETAPISETTAENILKSDENTQTSTSPSTGQVKNKLEEKPVDKFETQTDKKAIYSETKNEHTNMADKKKNRKKSPKPPRKTEMATDALASSASTAILQHESDISHIDETTLPVATSCPDMLTLKTQEISEITPDLLLQKKECKNDEIQKRKKSPKPAFDIESPSGSKDTHQLKQNLEIEDIIIIQAEVVSDEKAKNSETFMAHGVVADKKETDQKLKNKHGNDTSKRRKKSPKPPEKEIGHGIGEASMESPVEVQMPLIPNIQDTKLSPVIPVELETSKITPVSSPNEVTPDLIEYPRCSSEHLDSNNNMVIQEIAHADATLDVPLVTPDTPFIRSTNIDSPELSTSGIKVTQMEFENRNTEEKTDLKSKVMEVNQDMEELRLSIERSLAELTSLEKTDKDAEKKMEEENIKKSKSNTSVQAKSEVPAEEHLTFSNQNKASSIHAAAEVISCQEPVCPTRKDPKGKGKSKKKGKQESASQNQSAQSSIVSADSTKSTQSQDTKREGTNKSEQKSSEAQEKAKKQASATTENKDDDSNINEDDELNNRTDFEPIENFEDAMTSSADDVNKSFEMIANEANPRLIATQNNPEINVTAPQEDDKEGQQVKQNPVSPPKNLLGHPDIPVPSSRTDYKKEKNKPPNYRQAKVKIKDANQVQIATLEKSKQSKESQTESKRKQLNYKKPDESICVTNQNDDYVYKYSFRKVFLQCACHVCKKDLKQTIVPCSYCNLIFYCGQKHKDEDYPQHQALCFAVSTIVHLKDQKFIYADARDVTGHNYRLLRMQMIVSCEKVLKRRLAPWEQEALLYPRMCGHPACREWRQGKLADCEGCGQISYCSEHPDHLPKTHSRWCKSYNLYRALVKHQQTLGRLEPKLPTRVAELSPLPDNINEVLASMYEEKIDMSDIEYAALTQLATAPLTALFCLQHKANTANGITKKSILTLHIVGAELQFEADVLNKWEVFLLHLVPDVKELRVVLVGPDLNPSNLPLELLGKIKLCENCQRNNRRVVFGFQDKRTYHEFWASEDFTAPDLVCAFNPSIQRSSNYSGKDTWPSTINCILKLRTPFAITSYTLSELTSDLLRIQECATVGYNVVCAPRNNSFASVRPDRNFISDDEAPLLFKNHCVTVVCGV